MISHRPRVTRRVSRTEEQLNLLTPHLTHRLLSFKGRPLPAEVAYSYESVYPLA